MKGENPQPHMTPCSYINITPHYQHYIQWAMALKTRYPSHTLTHSLFKLLFIVFPFVFILFFDFQVTCDYYKIINYRINLEIPIIIIIIFYTWEDE